MTAPEIRSGSGFLLSLSSLAHEVSVAGMVHARRSE